MVKVIGTDEKAVKRVTCRNCASLLEYVPMEVTRSSYSDYGGGSDAWNYIHCPKCNNKVDV